MADKLKLGLVGADAAGPGWGPVAHMPALRGIEQGNNPLGELPVPERLRFVPKAVPFGPPQNVGQAYMRMAEAIDEGKPFAPNFDDALQVHKLLDSVQHSSDEGCAVKLG